MKVKREQRLNSEFQREIYDILKNKVKNHDITEMFSILEVDVTNDLKYAKVFVSVFSTNEERKQKTFNAICDSAKFVRGELAKIMRIRTVPELKFVMDTSSDYGNKIDKIISGFTYNTPEGDEDDA
ncbi:MAG: 30S ribosome-binding factor RbfA [Clostridia bacterium]|nr:30S ribosome-binding factor RbfA [Clostridia bacterium]